MNTTFVEYDDAGELFHVCTVQTTEGHMPPPPPDADDETKAAHARAVADAIAARDNAVRQELEGHRAEGLRLLVLPAGAEVPERGRHRVDVATGKLTRRTDAQLAAWRAAQAPAAPPAAQGAKP